jgi:PPOX class probable FMN-dependent enzyme
MSVFTEVDELRERYKEPGETVKRKVIDHVDVHAASFIGLSPFCCIATSDAEGELDVSPRGDVPGFVQVLDEHRLFLPDRPGNNRLDSFQNLLENPHIGMIFFIPGFFDVLRVNGTAVVAAPDDLLEASAVEGKVPKAGIVVHAKEVFMHCGRAVKRGRLWDPEAQVDRDVLPRIGVIIRDHVGAETDVGKNMNIHAEDVYMNQLY